MLSHSRSEQLCVGKNNEAYFCVFASLSKTQNNTNQVMLFPLVFLCFSIGCGNTRNTIALFVFFLGGQKCNLIFAFLTCGVCQASFSCCCFSAPRISFPFVSCFYCLHLFICSVVALFLLFLLCCAGIQLCNLSYLVLYLAYHTPKRAAALQSKFFGTKAKRDDPLAPSFN